MLVRSRAATAGIGATKIPIVIVLSGSCRDRNILDPCNICGGCGCHPSPAAIAVAAEHVDIDRI